MAKRQNQAFSPGLFHGLLLHVTRFQGKLWPQIPAFVLHRCQGFSWNQETQNIPHSALVDPCTVDLLLGGPCPSRKAPMLLSLGPGLKLNPSSAGLAYCLWTNLASPFVPCRWCRWCRAGYMWLTPQLFSSLCRLGHDLCLGIDAPFVKHVYHMSCTSGW